MGYNEGWPQRFHKMLTMPAAIMLSSKTRSNGQFDTSPDHDIDMMAYWL